MQDLILSMDKHPIFKFFRASFGEFISGFSEASCQIGTSLKTVTAY
jgi:hypothetical protein